MLPSIKVDFFRLAIQDHDISHGRGSRRRRRRRHLMIHILPFLDVYRLELVSPVEMGLDVVEPLRPSECPVVLEVDGPDAETAPVAGLAVPTDPAAGQQLLGLSGVQDLVLFLQMALERLPGVADAPAWPMGVALCELLAPPELALEVLAVLVSFPVVLAPKSLAALRKRARIRLFVSLQMLPRYTISQYFRKRKRYSRVTYLSSQGRWNDFPH